MKMYISISVFIIALQISFAPLANAYEVYSATSFCRATHAVGYSRNKITRSEALSTAINNCIGNGGISSCCKNRARISDIYHAAISHCTMTGAKGVGIAQTLTQAVNKAISQCIDRGGVRACCRNKISH